jgi:hypothetical protein
VIRTCSPKHRERFSDEALGKIALLLGLPEDHFLEYRYAYVAKRMLEDSAICDARYDLVTR